MKTRWMVRQCLGCGDLRQVGGTMHCDTCDIFTGTSERFEVVRVSTTPIDLDGPGQARAVDGATAKAAAQITIKRGTQRHKVLQAVRAAGAYGATAHELEVDTGIPYASLTPRIGELKRGGYIEETSRTRPSQYGVQQAVLILSMSGVWADAPERRSEVVAEEVARPLFDHSHDARDGFFTGETPETLFD